MFKNLISKKWVLTLAAMAMLAPVEAQSANLPGAAGSSPTQPNVCVARDRHFVFNNCSGSSQQVSIPVPVTSYKNYTVKARVRGNNTEVTSCKGVRWDNNNGDWVSTLEGATSSFDYVSVSLGTINVPSGSLTFECNLAQRINSPSYGAVHSVDWN
jgi:hypothetical protein